MSPSPLRNWAHADCIQAAMLVMTCATHSLVLYTATNTSLVGYPGLSSQQRGRVLASGVSPATSPPPALARKPSSMLLVQTHSCCHDDSATGTCLPGADLQAARRHCGAHASARHGFTCPV